MDTGVDTAAKNVHTVLAMATDKTVSISFRIPVEVNAELEADAKELGLAPGTLVRRVIEGRYSLPATAYKSRNRARMSSKPQLQDIEDE